MAATLPAARRCVPRLQQRVLEKGRAGLLGRRYAELTQAAQIEGQVREQGTELTQLARVAGGDNERL